MEKKKTILKKWWFWVGIVIILGMIANGGKDKNTSTGETTISETTIETHQIESIKDTPQSKAQEETREGTAQTQITNTPSPTIFSNPSNSLQVHYIDVGQADAIFIDYGETDILVDAGNKADGGNVVKYLKDLNTDDIEILVATHPHEDHIGGLDTVINSFKVDKILKPDIAENTETNRDFEIAITNKNISTECPEKGKIIEFGDLKLTVLSDKTKIYKETNNFSIVLKMVYGNTSFMFTGDAESDVEHDILATGVDLKADVLKAGHHGSASSTTANFLYKINPKYAVISVGKDNKYGHPDDIIINRLKIQNVPSLRTDELGTIVFTSNGENLSYDTVKTTTIKATATPKPTVPPSNTTSSNETPRRFKMD